MRPTQKASRRAKPRPQGFGEALGIRDQGVGFRGVGFRASGSGGLGA